MLIFHLTALALSGKLSIVRHLPVQRNTKNLPLPGPANHRNTAKSSKLYFDCHQLKYSTPKERKSNQKIETVIRNKKNKINR